MTNPTPIPPSNHECADCGHDTHSHRGIAEYYMIQSRTWNEATWNDGDSHVMLCVGCLEARIGRKLGMYDFTDCPVNRFMMRPRSLRLRQRMRIS